MSNYCKLFIIIPFVIMNTFLLRVITGLCFCCLNLWTEISDCNVKSLSKLRTNDNPPVITKVRISLYSFLFILDLFLRL